MAWVEVESDCLDPFWSQSILCPFYTPSRMFRSILHENINQKYKDRLRITKTEFQKERIYRKENIKI